MVWSTSVACQDGKVQERHRHESKQTSLFVHMSTYNLKASPADSFALCVLSFANFDLAQAGERLRYIRPARRVCCLSACQHSNRNRSGDHQQQQQQRFESSLCYSTLTSSATALNSHHAFHPPHHSGGDSSHTTYLGLRRTNHAEF